LALKKINWQTPLKLFDVAQTRQLEALASSNLSGFSLMEQAGLAIAQLAWKPLRIYINGVKK